ncbi:MAG TPA: FAD-binding oxidoreductase [archaeon]|nr:FAD-binding oxidoreductase [archaeon]
MKYRVFWKNPSYKPSPRLEKDTECDYLVVGAGVTGTLISYFLHKNGAKNIILIEKQTSSNGASGKGAGIIIPGGEADLGVMIRQSGKRAAVEYWKGMRFGVRAIEQIIKNEKIKCDFEKQPTIYGQMPYKTYNDVKEEYEIEKKFGFPVQFAKKNHIQKFVKTSLFKNAIIYKDGFSITPLKFTQNLLTKMKKYVKVYENTPLLKLKGNIATTPDGKISFDKIIFATDSYFVDRKIIPVKSTILVTEKLTKEQLHSIGMAERKMLFDSKKSYSYAKITTDNRLLVGGGSRRIRKKDDKTALDNGQVQQIKKFLKKVFPQLNLRFDYAWSGTLAETAQCTPFIKISGNKIVAVAVGSHAGAALTAKYVADKLTGRRSTFYNFIKLK